MSEKLSKNKFSDLGISADLMSVITGLKLEMPTPIQEKAIPPALSGSDLIGIAQTGTGKTFAFGIPILEALIKSRDSQVLILLPTRELALQVEENLRKLNTIAHVSIAVLIGGENFDRQLYLIRRGLRIIVGTPGRIADHLKRGTLKIDKVSILVLDEADMMLDMGFLPQVEDIMNYLPKQRQTMLFSATMPAGIVKLAAKHLKTPVRIEVAPSGTTAEQVDQEIYLIKPEDKLRHLENILAEYHGSVLVFMRTKYGAKGLVGKLKALGFAAAEIHSNLSLNQRKDALNGFKSGKYRILVGTDIAARGLDVNGIELVVNYNLPDNLEDYVHRIGRTGRAGKSGKAISFAAISERRQIKEIERLINKSLPMKELTHLKFPERLLKMEEKQELGQRDFLDNKFRGHPSKNSQPSFGGRKSFGDKKPFGAKKTFGSAKFSKNQNPENQTKSFSAKESFGARKSFNSRKSFAVRKTGSSSELFGFERDLLPERNIKSFRASSADRSSSPSRSHIGKPGKKFSPRSASARPSRFKK